MCRLVRRAAVALVVVGLLAAGSARLAEAGHGKGFGVSFCGPKVFHGGCYKPSFCYPSVGCYPKYPSYPSVGCFPKYPCYPTYPGGCFPKVPCYPTNPGCYAPVCPPCYPFQF